MYWMSAMAVSASSCRLAKTTCNRRRTCGTVKAAVFFPQPAALPHQEVMREQRHRHMLVPATPRAHLIVIHPDFALAFQDGRLDWPAHPTLAHQCGLRRAGRRIRQVGFQLRPLAQAAPQDEPLIWSWQPIPHRHHAHAGEQRDERPFGALLYLIGLPAQRAIARQRILGPIHSYGIPTRKVAIRRSALAWERAAVMPGMLASRNRAMTTARKSARTSGSVPVRVRLASSPNTTSRTQWFLFSICQCSCQRVNKREGEAASGSRLVIA